MGVVGQKVFIYTVMDPRDNSVFYVGETSNPKIRFNAHYSPLSECYRRLLEIKKEKLTAIFQIVDECSYSERFSLEKEWIMKMHKQGFILLNSFHEKLIKQLNQTKTT